MEDVTGGLGESRSGALGISCPTPADAWEGTCCLQAVRNVLLSPPLLTGLLVPGFNTAPGGRAACETQATERVFAILLISLPTSPFFCHFPLL